MNYDGMSFCTHQPENLGARYQWPHKNISWAIVADLPTIPHDSFRSAITEAFRRWSAVCGIQPFESADNPNVIIGIQSERPGNVLADCELPTGVPSVRMRVDTVENWCISNNPPANRIDLVRVLCHELGHGLGLSHGPAGCLMAPTYSLTISEPQSWDIVEMRARYGDPAPAPAPAPAPTGNDEELLRILRRGSRLFIRTTSGQELDL